MIVLGIDPSLTATGIASTSHTTWTVSGAELLGWWRQ